MLSARAYSFRQKSRLAISLSWIGGYTNVIVFMVTGTLVSHMTGSTTQMGRWIGIGEFWRALFFAFLLFSFTFGAVLSALLTESAKRRGWRSKYILPMALEAMLLGVLCFHMGHANPAGEGLWLYQTTGAA